MSLNDVFKPPNRLPPNKIPQPLKNFFELSANLFCSGVAFKTQLEWQQFRSCTKHYAGSWLTVVGCIAVSDHNATNKTRNVRKCHWFSCLGFGGFGFGESIFHIGCWRFVPRPSNAFTHWAHVNWSVILNKLDQLVFPPLFAWSWQNFKSSKSLMSYKKFRHDQGFMMTQISNLDSYKKKDFESSKSI